MFEKIFFCSRIDICKSYIPLWATSVFSTSSVPVWVIVVCGRPCIFNCFRVLEIRLSLHWVCPSVGSCIGLHRSHAVHSCGPELHIHMGRRTFEEDVPVCMCIFSALDTRVSCAKTAEQIQVPFEVKTHVGPRNIVLDGDHIPPQQGALLRGLGIIQK